jgi:CYTH domain-containing protein
MSAELPKYSLPEIERRWLVDLSAVDLRSTAFCEIEDLYIADSRLRLRKVSGPNGRTFKLGKKYGKRTALSEPITNLYLTEDEYRRFAGLPGRRIHKRRYALASGSLDVYLEPNKGLAVLEVEFHSEQSAQEFTPPHFATREITNEPEFSGARLAGDRATV